jgi:hypothetical protein
MRDGENIMPKRWLTQLAVWLTRGVWQRRIDATLQRARARGLITEEQIRGLAALFAAQREPHSEEPRP